MVYGVMFDQLTGKLGQIFDRLRGRGALSPADVDAGLDEVRVALLDADVALPVVKSFLGQVRAKAQGEAVLRSVTPGQMVVKLVHDALVEVLGGEGSAGLDLDAPPPVPVLLLGLQGSGKTTTAAKIALQLKTRDKKKVLLASLDVARPAAQEQLRVLGEQAGVATLPVVVGEMPVGIARRAMEAGRFGGYDAVLLDAAGRLHLDEALMAEAAAVRDAVRPHETLLVADAMTGQDAVRIAQSFHQRVGITGIVLTRVDGDGRGGAALSMRAVTGQPIKLMGVGEKLDALEPFHPSRIASRILGMGDVVSLVEKAAATVEREEAEKVAARMEKGEFDLNDMADQLRRMRQMGGLSGVMNLLPGVGALQKQMAAAKIDENVLRRQEAIIQSMTKKERRLPRIIQASRKRRIAAGAGVHVSEINKLLKQHQQAADMMKRMKKLGQKGFMRAGLPQMTQIRNEFK
jgi:signal recognition particle subunit SRP54